jgi:C4-dicarboxylate-specific signal transduction histidine kinase
LLVLIAVGATAMVLGAVMISFQRQSTAQATLTARLLPHAMTASADGMAPGYGHVNVVDIVAELSTILSRLLPEARRQFSEVTTAIQPDLVAASDPAAFRQALTDLFEAALQRAPCGRIIVTAGRQGPRVAITVSDDGMVAGLHATESVLRGTSQLLAMQGGTLEIDMRPGEGTITTMRLFVPSLAAPSDVSAIPVMRAVPAVA